MAPAGFYIALVSTIKENADPAADLAFGLKQLPPPLQQFVSVDPVFEPLSDGRRQGCVGTQTDTHDVVGHSEATMS